MKQIDWTNNNNLNVLYDFFDGETLNTLNVFFNKEISRLEKLGVDFSKNDYYKNEEFQKNNSYIPLLSIPVNLIIEKCVIGQKRLEKIYGSYDLIITRELTKKEREINEWCTVLYCKITCGEKDLRQYRTIMISQILLIFSITVSKSLNIGSDYVCKPFHCTEKYYLKSVLSNYAVLP